MQGLNVSPLLFSYSLGSDLLCAQSGTEPPTRHFTRKTSGKRSSNGQTSSATPKLPSRTSRNQPQAGYSNATYGPLFQAILAQGVGHTVPEHEVNVLQFFGLDTLQPGPVPSTSVGPTGPVSTPGTTTLSPATTPTTTHTTSLLPPPTPPPSSTPTTGQAKWGQCGGIGWTGPTTCISSTCTYSNPVSLHRRLSHIHFPLTVSSVSSIVLQSVFVEAPLRRIGVQFWVAISSLFLAVEDACSVRARSVYDLL